MKTITPQLEGPRTRVAESQPEYEPVTIVRLNDPAYPRGYLGRDNSVVMAFELTDDERARVIAGERTIYVALLTFGDPQDPLRISVGAEEMAAVFGVEALVRRCPVFAETADGAITSWRCLRDAGHPAGGENNGHLYAFDIAPAPAGALERIREADDAAHGGDDA